MIEGVSGGFGPIDGPGRIGRIDSRAERLRQHLDRNDRIEFRYRSRRFRGTVVELRRNALIVSFKLKGEEVARPVAYGSILKVLNR